MLVSPRLENFFFQTLAPNFFRWAHFGKKPSEMSSLGKFGVELFGNSRRVHTEGRNRNRKKDFFLKKTV